MIVARGMADILGVDVMEVFEQTKEDNYYEVVKKKVDTDLKDQVLEFKAEIGEKYGIGNCIKVIENYKRYYTHDNFLADVLGFVGGDSQGLEGLEATMATADVITFSIALPFAISIIRELSAREKGEIS